MTTITKTSKKAKQLIDNARNINVYSLTNYFTGKPLAAEPVRWSDPDGHNMRKLITVSQPDFLRYELSLRGAKLSNDGNGKYSINVHSNLWYTFEIESPNYTVHHEVARLHDEEGMDWTSALIACNID